jgi:PiT family inorganic phosphate transporter
MPDPVLVSVVYLNVVALMFVFSKGFHEAANSISCIVSTRVLSQKYALYWAAFSNFVAALVIGTSWSRPID